MQQENVGVVEVLDVSRPGDLSPDDPAVTVGRL
jgi:hypothetical protein